MRRLGLLFCFFGITTLLQIGDVSARTVRIIGGDYSVKGQFPYLVSIQTSGQHHCGGSIVADQYILRAAHCLINDNNIAPYKAYRVVFDRLKQRLTLGGNSVLQMVRLPRSGDSYAGCTAVISGYGYTSIEMEFDPTTRRKVEVTIEKNNYLIYPGQICGQVKQEDRLHQGICSGDSGGPLIVDHVQFGVVSFSPIGCDEFEMASTYTRVSQYLLFIDTVINGKMSGELNRTGTCGGGIIGDRFVLTAAHCVVNESGDFYKGDYKVVAGSIDLTVVHGVSISVEKAYVPSSYRSINSPNDIAVLKDYTGQKAVITGYGYTWINTIFDWIELEGGTDYKLKYSNVTIVSHDECNSESVFVKVNRRMQICGQMEQRDPSNPKGVCSGDSGGPLVIGNTVIGVVHSSPGGCNENHGSTIYTRVSTFLPFIAQAIEDRASPNIRVFHY
ncbi:chymotrypsin-like [Nasonia vitripennis]|uniref:Peptidase S1 domain-containing protein n=1 Tax=Nasonia vitripennis TaxID=7425 RepID=A0A7M7Q196_NASVI|nr:chymotrypsin-like [Nasonia vitripennis]